MVYYISAEPRALEATDPVFSKIQGTKTYKGLFHNADAEIKIIGKFNLTDNGTI